MTDTRPLLIHGGAVLPCDGGAPCEALVVENGRIKATGTREDMRTAAGRDAAVLDVEGATVLPGLIDTHPHAMHFTALRNSMLDLLDARNHAEIVARIAARAKVTPKGQWIICTPVGEPHYFIRRSYRDLEEGRLPDRSILDQATTEHPVMIQAWAPRIPNVCAFNSEALKRLGISWVTPPRVCDVWIDRDNHGNPSGILRGSVTNYYTHDPFWLQIWRQLPMPPEDIWVAGGRAGMAEMNALGVTTIYEGHSTEPPHIEAYRTLRRNNEMSCRVLTALDVANTAFNPHYRPSDAELLATLELTHAWTELSDPLHRHSGVTVSRSGPCFPGFINLYEPFRSPYGELKYGYVFLPKETEEAVVDFCVKRDLRFNSVSATPKDHDELLHSVGRHPGLDVRERGWIIMHAIMVSEAHARAYAEHGFKFTTCKGFHWGKGDMYGERIGKHIWKDLIPLRRLLDHGIEVGCGTDWGPRNAFEQMQLAVTCEFAGSGYRNLDAGQAVTREESLLMWTRDAARVLEWEGIGTLAAGHHGDVAVVDRNPLDCPLEDLADTRVLKTLLGGQTVYDAGALG